MSFPVREVRVRIKGVERKREIVKQQLFQGQETVLALEVSCAFNFALLFSSLFFPFSASGFDYPFPLLLFSFGMFFVLPSVFASFGFAVSL